MVEGELGRAAGNGYRIVAATTVRKWPDVTLAGVDKLINRLAVIGCQCLARSDSPYELLSKMTKITQCNE